MFHSNIRKCSFRNQAVDLSSMLPQSVVNVAATNKRRQGPVSPPGLRGAPLVPGDKSHFTEQEAAREPLNSGTVAA